MLIRWHKNSALVSAILWIGIGAITIYSVALSSFGWGINLIMGFLFILLGWFLYIRANCFHRFFLTSTADIQNNPHFKRFLRLDLMFVLSTCLVGGLLLSASISRVFGEGYAVFG